MEKSRSWLPALLERPGVQAMVACTIMLCACSNADSVTGPLTASPAPTTPVPAPIWRGEQTKLSESGPCSSHTAWTRAGILWSVDIQGNDFKLVEDPIEDGIVYTGTLEADAFSAAYQQPQYANQPCQFRESSIKGSFSSDRRGFDAEEVWIFGAPGSEETRVLTRWRVTAFR